MEKISRRDFSKKVAAGVAGLTAMNSGLFSLNGLTEGLAGKDDSRPNFVFITSDQHNAKYLGYVDHPFIKTPNLDKLAGRGSAFMNNYSGSPLCAPGRSSMMTGMYSSDLNSFCNTTVYDGSFPTWAKRMKDSGYYCWATGKQDSNPNFDLGFKEVEVTHEHFKNPDITSLFRRPSIYRINERKQVDGEVRKQNHYDEKYLNNVIHFLKNESTKLKQPWLCYVGFEEPHPPFKGPQKYYEEYLSKVEAPKLSIEELESLPLPYEAMRNFKLISTPIPVDRIKRALAGYFAMISELDANVGKILDTLEETGQLKNTYIIYTSDHGESLGEHGLWFKNNLYDAAAKTPLIISGPGIPKGKKFFEPTGHIDLAAAILELAGIKNVKELRGTSLMPLINGYTEKAPQFAYSESHSEGNITGSCMIRAGDWKLIHFSYYDDLLFDLKDDPDEKKNLINDPKFKDKADELSRLLYSKVNPEEITERAFRLQEKILQNYVDTKNEEQLIDMFRSRLGDGLSKDLVKKLKS